MIDRKRLASDALKSAASLRKKLGYDLSSPVNIYDLCERAEVPVRFVEINMEGMYVHLGEGIKPTILISALRPFHRKIYTCAHELGHHHFGHGMTVDEVSSSNAGYTHEEFLVDAFAGYLLMPPVGLKGAFIKRNLNFETITSLDCFVVACSFGVGYSTLIKHLLFNSYISQFKADSLLKVSLKKLKQSIISEDIKETLFVIDEYFPGKTLDIETSSYIVLPHGIVAEDERFLKEKKQISTGTLYQAVNTGMSRLYSKYNDWSCFVRIQNYEYVGLSRYRHLSN